MKVRRGVGEHITWHSSVDQDNLRLKEFQHGVEPIMEVPFVFPTAHTAIGTHRHDSVLFKPQEGKGNVCDPGPIPPFKLFAEVLFLSRSKPIYTYFSIMSKIGGDTHGYLD